MGHLRPRLRAWWGARRGACVDVSGHRIMVPPGVLDPCLFRSGGWFAAQVAASAAAQAGGRVLDLGCGTGVVGVLAQAAGARVVSTDVDPRACAAARENGVKAVRRGDLFKPVQGERFDLICFNPPYLQGVRHTHRLALALNGKPGHPLIRRFAAEVTDHLSPRGQAWVVLSDRAPGAAAALGPGWDVITADAVEDEVLAIWARTGD